MVATRHHWGISLYVLFIVLWINLDFGTGTLYGQGVYFARDASYSDRYAVADSQGNKRMYLTQVLTGEFTVGKQDTTLPPAKNPKANPNVLFDSTVNVEANPSIFVVYFDAQNYPAYLITYQ